MASPKAAIVNIIELIRNISLVAFGEAKIYIDILFVILLIKMLSPIKIFKSEHLLQFFWATLH